MEYRSTQVGWPILLPVALGVLAPLVLLTAPGAEKAPGAHAMALIVPVFFLSMAFLFGWLSAAVGAGELRITFGIGLIRKTIPLSEIAAARAVDLPWLHGYGIRMTGEGWLWRASGTKAVRLELRTGKRFSVGTSDPEGLLQTLRVNGVSVG